RRVGRRQGVPQGVGAGGRGRPGPADVRPGAEAAGGARPQPGGGGPPAGGGGGAAAGGGGGAAGGGRGAPRGGGGGVRPPRRPPELAARVRQRHEAVPGPRGGSQPGGAAAGAVRGREAAGVAGRGQPLRGCSGCGGESVDWGTARAGRPMVWVVDGPRRHAPSPPDPVRLNRRLLQRPANITPLRFDRPVWLSGIFPWWF